MDQLAATDLRGYGGGLEAQQAEKMLLEQVLQGRGGEGALLPSILLLLLLLLLLAVNAVGNC